MCTVDAWFATGEVGLCAHAGGASGGSVVRACAHARVRLRMMRTSSSPKSESSCWKRVLAQFCRPYMMTIGAMSFRKRKLRRGLSVAFRSQPPQYLPASERAGERASSSAQGEHARAGRRRAAIAFARHAGFKNGMRYYS